VVLYFIPFQQLTTIFPVVVRPLLNGTAWRLV